MTQRQQAELVMRLHRDVRWLERELRRIRDAKECSGDKLRDIAAESLATARRRVARTRTRPLGQ